MAKYCTECGSKLQSDSKKCKNCGQAEQSDDFNFSIGDSVIQRSKIGTVAGDGVGIAKTVHIHKGSETNQCPNCKNPLGMDNKLIKCKICKNFNYCNVCQNYFERESIYRGHQLDFDRICEKCYPQHLKLQKRKIAYIIKTKLKVEEEERGEVVKKLIEEVKQLKREAISYKLDLRKMESKYQTATELYNRKEFHKAEAKYLEIVDGISEIIQCYKNQQKEKEVQKRRKMRKKIITISIIIFSLILIVGASFFIYKNSRSDSKKIIGRWKGKGDGGEDVLIFYESGIVYRGSTDKVGIYGEWEIENHKLVIHLHESPLTEEYSYDFSFWGDELTLRIGGSETKYDKMDYSIFEL